MSSGDNAVGKAAPIKDSKAILTLFGDLTGRLYNLLTRVRNVRRGLYKEEPDEKRTDEKRDENPTFSEQFRYIASDNIDYLNDLEAEIELLERF